MTEMSMRERVARAIIAADPQLAIKDQYWVDYLKEADAAIAAMREPTSSMREAAYEAVALSDAWHIDDDRRWAKSFNAAIDAALSEKAP